MNRENVTELLKNYRNYKYAVNQYERHKGRPAAGVANYSGMSGGSGAQELFFAPNGRMADMGHTSLDDAMDYEQYSEVVKDIDGGLDLLTAEEHSVVRLKWIEGRTLKEIADEKKYSLETVKRNHKRALEKLSICYRFVKIPGIEEIPTRGSQHFRNPNMDKMTLL